MQASRLTAILAATAALALPATAVAKGDAPGNGNAPGKGNAPSSAQLEPVPNLPVNACHDSTLPRDYGTNFAAPSDPLGFGFANETAIGWEGNLYAPFEYLSGSYFARGVPATYKSGNQSLCGGMYSFSAYTYGLTPGQAPAPGSVHWTMADNYLPGDDHVVHPRSGGHLDHRLRQQATDRRQPGRAGLHPGERDQQRVGGGERPAWPVRAESGVSEPGLRHGGAGQTVHHDFVAAVDTFSPTVSLPSVGALTSSRSNRGALPYDTAYQPHGRLLERHGCRSSRDSRCPTSPCPTPTTWHDPGHRDRQRLQGRLHLHQDRAGRRSAVLRRQQLRLAAQPRRARDPGQSLRAAATSPTRRTCCSPPGSRSRPTSTSSAPTGTGTGPWRTPVAWADVPARDQRHRVRQSKYFHDDANGPSQWGPSLYTMMHTDFLSQLNAAGYLRPLRRQRLARAPGCSTTRRRSPAWPPTSTSPAASADSSEAQWANTAYTSLLNAVNAVLATNE